MKPLICIFILFFFSFCTQAQFIEIGGSLGGSTYQGDINHLSSKLSFQGAKFLNSIHIGYHFGDSYFLKIRYSSASIGAYDSEALDKERKLRNLHFRSRISEWSLTHEFELLDVFKVFKNSRFKPVVHFGIAYFKFNPQAKYRGNWVDLQPLGTEGQFLPGSSTKPYNLHQFSIPFGFGLKYYITDHFYVGVEISPRITFTDYLDDVSGYYPDLAQLRVEGGEKAFALSYQAAIKQPDVPIQNVSGKGRGNPTDNDWYIFNTFTIGYKINPFLMIKQRKSFKHGRKCNFF